MNLIVHPPMLITRFFKEMVWNIPGNDKVLHLTFDDGPIPELTPWILDVLAHYNAKATFFLVGDNVRKHPKLYHRIVAEGHSVGNHTFHHLNGWKTDTYAYMKDVEKADFLIHSNLFRPPYGKLSRNQRELLTDMGKQIVMWDVLTRDYDPKVTKEQCLNYVLDYARKGSVIVFHDNLKAQENMKFALINTLEIFSNKGYRFDRITDNNNSLKLAV